MTDHISTHQAEDDARNETILIYVNGKIVPKAQATVSVYDSGFMLGDGVWEGIRLYNGRWTFLDEHIARLFEAAKAIDLDIGMTPDQVISAVLETQAANGMTTDAHARLMLTRGVKTRPFQHPKLSQQGPTMVIIMEHSLPKIPRPITLATVPHMRGLPMTQDPKLNSHSKLNCILACIAAQKAGADEGLMLDNKLAETLVRSINDASERLAAEGRPAICVVAPQIRRPFSNFVKPHVPQLIILGFNELPENRHVEVVASIGATESLATPAAPQKV